MDLFASVREALEGLPQVRVAYVFGSRVAGRPRPGSDLDIAVSFALREKGYRLRALGVEHARRHAHRVWESLSEDERLKRSRRNFDRMYRRFHGKVGLVSGSA